MLQVQELPALFKWMWRGGNSQACNKKIARSSSAEQGLACSSEEVEDGIRHMNSKHKYNLGAVAEQDEKSSVEEGW